MFTNKPVWGRKFCTFAASHETSSCRCFAFADFRGCSSCNNGGSAAWAADLAVRRLCRGLLAVVRSWKTLYFLIRAFSSMEMCTMLELDFYYNNCNKGGSAAWAADLAVSCLCRGLLAVYRSWEPLYFLIRAFCFAGQSMETFCAPVRIHHLRPVKGRRRYQDKLRFTLPSTCSHPPSLC